MTGKNDLPDEITNVVLRWLENLQSQLTHSWMDFFFALCADFGRVLNAQTVLRVYLIEGRWSAEKIAGEPSEPPWNLIAEVADRGKPGIADPWVVLPVHGGAGVELVAFKLGKGQGYLSEALAHQLGRAISTIRSMSVQWVRAQLRLSRQQKIVDAARSWIATRDCDRLFEEIATAATQILECERATLFLWDRRARVLVGRPALGVPGGQLVVPDDRGVVGQVIRSGRPARAEASNKHSLIDHSVDEQLGFKTRNVLCVPLRGKDGSIQGVFEVLNKQAGMFSDEDEETLTTIAAFAAASLDNAREHQLLLDSHTQLVRQVAAEVELVGVSQAIENIRALVRRVADTDLTVLLLGENGTGKEVAARLIHYHSRRRQFPFLAVNCAAIPDTLAESELFGHERGAFTDAVRARPGKFELAGKGTLFLDEVGELSLACQAKLLRVLEDRTFVRVGGSTPLVCEARIIAATNQDLGELVRARKFREDLYYRLNGLTIEIPPLRARREDILPLARYFLEKFCPRARRAIPQFTPEAERFLQDYPWPGNVRELRNAMERLAYLTTSEVVDVEDVKFLVGWHGRAHPSMEPVVAADLTSYSSVSLSDATRLFQRRYVEKVLADTGGNLTEAARRLGLHRSNFYRKLRQLGIPLPRKE